MKEYKVVCYQEENAVVPRKMIEEKVNEMAYDKWTLTQFSTGGYVDSNKPHTWVYLVFEREKSD